MIAEFMQPADVFYALMVLITVYRHSVYSFDKD